MFFFFFKKKETPYPIRDMQHKYYYPMRRTIKELIRVNVYFFFHRTNRRVYYLYGGGLVRNALRKTEIAFYCVDEGGVEWKNALATRSSRYRVRLLSVLTVRVHIVVRWSCGSSVTCATIITIIIIIDVGKLRNAGEEVVKNVQWYGAEIRIEIISSSDVTY